MKNMLTLKGDSEKNNKKRKFILLKWQTNWTKWKLIERSEKLIEGSEIKLSKRINPMCRS